jgi:hypothetical protein
MHLVLRNAGRRARRDDQLSSPKTYSFQLGVTYSNGKAAGTVADDVSLQITP